MKATWQRHVIAASGYSELGMLDDAANALEEIEPEDKTRTEVLSVRVDLYRAARKWDMVAAVASHLVNVEPEGLNAGRCSVIGQSQTNGPRSAWAVRLRKS